MIDCMGINSATETILTRLNHSMPTVQRFISRLDQELSVSPAYYNANVSVTRTIFQDSTARNMCHNNSGKQGIQVTAPTQHNQQGSDPIAYAIVSRDHSKTF